MRKLNGKCDRFERRAFRCAVAASFLFHTCIMVYAHSHWEMSRQLDRPVFEFIHYDEIGGAAGGADTDDTVEQQESQAAPEEEATQLPVPEAESGENTPDMASEDKEPEEEPEPIKEITEIPEPEVEIEPEQETAVKEKPDPVIVETPTPLLEDKQPEEEPILLAEAPLARPKPRRTTPSEASPPPAPPPTPLIVASVPLESQEQILGGGGMGDGHGGSADGPETGNPDLLRVYAGEIQRQLAAYKQYPPEAKRLDIEGIVEVQFTVTKDGQVRDVGMVASSGNTALDSEALALPTRAAPFPRIPDVLRRQSLTLIMPIQFSLQ